MVPDEMRMSEITLDKCGKPPLSEGSFRQAVRACQDVMSSDRIIAAPARNAQPLGPVFDKVLPLADPQQKPWLENHVCNDSRRKEPQCEQEDDETCPQENESPERHQISSRCNTRSRHDGLIVQPEIPGGEIFMELEKIVEQEICRQEG